MSSLSSVTAAGALSNCMHVVRLDVYLINTNYWYHMMWILVIIGSGNNLSRFRHQTITWANSFSEKFATSLRCMFWNIFPIRCQFIPEKHPLSYRNHTVGSRIASFCNVLMLLFIKIKRRCHFDDIFAGDATKWCQNNNFWCSHWWKFRRNDISLWVFRAFL